MYAKTIEYENYNGENIKETFYFNLTKSEMAILEAKTPGGWSNYMQSIMDKKDGPAVMEMFEKLLRASYGEKSADGRNFKKSNAIFEDFESCPAYDIIVLELLTNEAFAKEFIFGIMPKDLVEQAKKDGKASQFFN